VFILAVPVIATVYLAVFGRRLWLAVRPAVATVLGATVIGSVYVEEAWRRAPAPVRVSPARAAAVMALALVFASASVYGAPVRAAGPRELALDTAISYIGVPYRLGAERKDLVDCSGLIYRIFADIGELPRVGGRRLRSVGYYRWFASRGLASLEAADAERGDLIFYRNPNHIGIYMGDGRVLSALMSGVKIHDLRGITAQFVAVLKVDWSVGDPAPDDSPPGDDGSKPKDTDAGKPDAKPDADKPDDTKPGATTEEPAANRPDGPRGFATGTMNLRQAADPDARIIGWVSRGTTFTILGTGNSPSGALWYEVKTRSGKSGWIYSRWVRPLED
ncbi:MAG TPA: NlpC/P60 family protein, partial [Candidatus Limnocylindrales bacterium]